jgi:hypothetical protein
MAVETEVLTLDQTTRAVSELSTAAGGNGIHEDDLKAAIGELEDLAISAALWEGWITGQFEIRWDSNGKELQWRNADV